MKLNFSVLPDWNETLTVAFQQLRRIAFVVEESFSFGDFDPQINWGGMTTSAISVNSTRYLKIFNMLWVSIDIQATLGAPFSNILSINLPFNVAGEAGRIQSSGAFVQNAGSAEVGFIIVSGKTNNVFFYRNAFPNFSAGVARVIYNGFFEVV